jgi:BarA-like signal transduction histidine kinase
MMDYKGWQMKYRPVLQELNSRVSLMMVSLMISQGRNPAVQSEAIRKSVP